MSTRLPNVDHIMWVSVGISIIAIAGLFFWLFRKNTISVINHYTSQSIGGRTSVLTGLPCANADRRPVAVMVSSDQEARPLSGIGQADIVFEMPVTPNGITRIMAVYQCTDPKEIGSIRSARGSFIPLVQGLSPIYVHWGGEHQAEDLLKTGITSDVDCLLWDGTTCPRKRGVKPPGNGFSTMPLIRQRAVSLGYSASSSLEGFLHSDTKPKVNLADLVPEISIPWPLGMDVKFVYDSATNTYLRSRTGKPEVDATTSEQVRVSVVIVMHTDAIFLYDQYINVRTTGQGPADLYQNGQHQSIVWSKPTATSPLQFTQGQGKPVALAPGTIWVAIDAPLPEVP